MPLAAQASDELAAAMEWAKVAIQEPIAPEDVRRWSRQQYLRMAVTDCEKDGRSRCMQVINRYREALATGETGPVSSPRQPVHEAQAPQINDPPPVAATPAGLKASFLRAWQVPGPVPGKGVRGAVVSDIAAGGTGKVYVTDMEGRNNWLRVYDEGGAVLEVWEGFRQPKQVAVSADGRVYVADAPRIDNRDRPRVQVFEAGGARVGGWDLRAPPVLAAGRDGTVHAASAYQLLRYRTDGTVLGDWALPRGTAEGQFYALTALAVDTAGTVLIADHTLNRVSAVSAEGELLRSWGSRGTGDDQFWTISDIAVDPQGRVYVADSNRIRVFTPEGRFLGSWGEGLGGEARFRSPVAIAVDGRGRVYVADGSRIRIVVFQVEIGAASTSS